jgi:hypothetical protein
MTRLHVFAFAFVAANGLSNLGSVQVRPTHGTNNTVDTLDKTLPDVNELLPSRSFSAMKLTVAELEKHMVEEQQQSVTTLQHIKSEYERTLLMQKKNNSHIKRVNLLISSRVRVKQKYNDVLRQQASSLVSANTVLKNELEELNSNLSLAKDFVQDGLAASSMNESEIHVLADLAELDDKARLISRKQALLGALSGSPKQLSLMESVEDVRERSSNDIMYTLTSSFARLASDSNTSQNLLKEAFEKKRSEAEIEHDGLLRDQALLNRTADEAEKLHDRLSAAVSHLSKAHDNLVARIKAIRAFAFHLGSAASGDSGSADQTRDAGVVNHERAKTRRSSRRVKVAAGVAKSLNRSS